MKERIPDSIINRGMPIEEPNPQPQIRQIAENNSDWDYSNEAKKLYGRTDVIIDRLYPVIHTPRFQGRLPSVLIAIDTLRNQKVLAAYRLIPDEYGLNFKITLNQQHYEDKEVEGNKTKAWRWGEWAQMETLVHEIGHHWQQMLGDNPFKPTSRVSHNKEFCNKMKQIGIHCAPEGYHEKVADRDSPFGILMAEWGIKPPFGAPEGKFKIHWFRDLFRGRERKGRSTLSKWSCECPYYLRVGKKDWPGAVCNKCGTEYLRAK